MFAKIQFIDLKQKEKEKDYTIRNPLILKYNSIIEPKKNAEIGKTIDPEQRTLTGKNANDIKHKINSMRL